MIVDSSLWSEDDFICKIFITMLALKDSDDVCRLNAYQLAMRSHKTEKEVLEALKVLSSPDTLRVEPQPFEGRRIQAVEDGWKILNGEKYREMVRDEMKKARWRRAKANQRRKQMEKEDAAIAAQFAGKNPPPAPRGYEEGAEI
jgi:hypothetical protein